MDWLEQVKREIEEFHNTKYGQMSDGQLRKLETNRFNGKVTGDKNKKSGQISALGKKWGAICKENGHLARISKMGGDKHVKSGHLKSISSVGGQQAKPHLRKLDYKKAEEIRQVYSKGNVTYKDLSKQFGIAPSSIAQIIRNETYTKP